MITLENRKTNFIKKLRVSKNDEYELIGEYVKLREKTEFLHKICGHVWRTQPVTLLKAEGNLGCPKCQYRQKSITTEQFKENLFKAHEGRYSLVEGQIYINNRVKLKVSHNYCGTVFSVSPVSILTNNSCPKCRYSSWKGKTTKTFEEELHKLKGDEYILANGSRYRGANEKVRVCHTLCGYEWDVRASHILHRSGCPKCNESKGEKFIAEFLTSEGIKFEKEFIFSDCVNHKELPFDFALFDKDNTLIGLVEYDGVQHFKAFKHFGGVEKLKRQQFNDNTKNIYCTNNNIRLLRLPYTLSNEEIKKSLKKFIVEK